MQQDQILGKMIFFASVLLVLASVGSAAPNWQIEILDQPWSYANVSNGSQTVQLANLSTTNGVPIGQDSLVNGYFNYTYQSPEFEKNITGEMTHLKGGVWYASFELNNVTAGEVQFEAYGDTKSDTVVDATSKRNKTREFTFDNYTVNVISGFQEEYRPGQEISLEVNVTDQWDDEAEGAADVSVYFTNVTYTSPITGIKNYDNGQLYYFNDRVRIPNIPDTNFVMHVNATSGTEKLSTGVESFRIKTLDVVKAKNIYVNTTSSRCDSQKMVEICEPNATIEAGFKVTQSVAENVSMSLLTRNSTGLYEMKDLQVTNGTNVYNTSFQYPDLNTTRWDREVILRFNATGSGGTDIDYYNITKANYTIEDYTSRTTYQGSYFSVKTFIGFPYSSNPYPEGWLKNVTVDIKSPTGARFRSYNLSDMEFKEDTDLWTNMIEIPSDAENGTYEITASAYNKYGDRTSLDPVTFVVKAVDQTFESPGQVSYGFTKTGVYFRNITLNNSISSANEINPEINGEIADFTSVNNSAGNITIPASGTKDLRLKFNMTRVDDYSGNVTLYDTSTPYNRTTLIEINAPYCGLRNETICIETDQWLNRTTDQRKFIQEEITFHYLGDNGTNTTLDLSVTGEIADRLQVSANRTDFPHSTVITANYSAMRPFNGTGTIVMKADGRTLRLHTELVANVTVPEKGMEVNVSQVEIGPLVEGSDTQMMVSLSNTGDLQIDGLQANSDRFTVSLADPEALDPGEERTYQVDFSAVSVPDGTVGPVTITGQTSQGEVQVQFSVTALTMPAAAIIESDLSSRIDNLQQQTDDQDLMTQLTNARAKITAIETDISRGNLQQAYETYQNVQATLNSVETQIQSGDNQQDNQQNQQNNTQNQTNQQEPPADEPQQQGGGNMIIILAIVLLVLLLIGFVVYTSLIPEEGDRLYDLLGEG
ncbi:MAG: hypothetical protein ABEK01_02670 [Candidatus Nanohaloarchaea archaeon]